MVTEIGMNEVMKNTANKLKIGKRYRLPNAFLVNEDGRHPITSCICVGKYNKYAVFETPNGNLQTYSYYELSTGIVNEYRRTSTYLAERNSNNIVSLV